MFSVAVATLVPVPITFCVAPARETTALRAALDDVPDAVDVAPRFTVVRPVVALRADTAGVAALRVDVALRAAVALRVDVATDRVDADVAAVAAPPPRRCCGTAASAVKETPINIMQKNASLFIQNPFNIHLILS